MNEDKTVAIARLENMPGWVEDIDLGRVETRPRWLEDVDLGWAYRTRQQKQGDVLIVEARFTIPNVTIEYMFKRLGNEYVFDDCCDHEKRNKLICREKRRREKCGAWPVKSFVSKRAPADNLVLRKKPVERVFIPVEQLIVEEAEKIIETIMRQKIKSKFTDDEFRLDAADHQLTGMWQRRKGRSDEEEEQERLVAARIAEKAAMAFYRGYGKTVTDVSIKQVAADEENNTEWKHCDLEADNDKIDVKNARRKGSRMTGHYVQKKFDRPALEDIKICAMVSLQDKDKAGPRGGPVECIGETSTRKLNRLREAFSNMEGIDMEATLNKNTYRNAFYQRGDCRVFPAWLFDYPEYVYGRRQDDLRTFRATVAEHTRVTGAILEENRVLGLLPVMVAAGVEIPVTGATGAEKPARLFAADLANRVREYGLSLPAIYLTVLGHFLDRVRNPGDTAWETGLASLYKKCLFLRGKEDRPLGVYDPLGVIRGLIEVLEQLWKSDNRSHIKGLRAFRLVNFNILQGKEAPSAGWKTLVAYCGGPPQRNAGKQPKGPCGRYPLVIGQAKTCENCRKLVCDECGYCSDACVKKQPAAVNKNALYPDYEYEMTQAAVEWGKYPEMRH